MFIKAKAIDVSMFDKGGAVLIGFEGADKSRIEVAMPIDDFAIARSGFLRVFEVARRRQLPSAGGLHKVAYSDAKTIEPRADIVSRRMYFVIDRGMVGEVAYALPLDDAVELGNAIEREHDRWVAGNDNPGRPQ